MEQPLPTEKGHSEPVLVSIKYLIFRNNNVSCAMASTFIFKDQLIADQESCQLKCGVGQAISLFMPPGSVLITRSS